MIDLSIDEIPKLIGGKLVLSSNQKSVSRICIDSRKIQSGDLFIAIKGENFDGADYIEEALEKGAIGYIVGLKALQDIASLVLQKVNPKVIAITGSTGKTSVKDMLKSILSLKYKVVASEGNYNNEVGLPLTLLNVTDKTEVVILEMAMRGLGQISQLCKIAPPDYAVITNIGHSHIEKLQTAQNIIKAKSEIIEGLKKDGTVFLNSDDAATDQLLRGHPFSKGMSPNKILAWQSHGVVLFGKDEKADVRYNNVSYDNLARPSFTLSPLTSHLSPLINLPVPGAHFVFNAVAAAAVALELGMDLAQIKKGLESAVITSGRMQICQVNRWLILNDSYNASPDSMRAALDVLKDIKANRKIAVLGDMRELGVISEDEHYKIGLKAADLGLEVLLTVGEAAKSIAAGALAGGIPRKKVISFTDTDALNEQIISYLTPGDAILIKASRAIELEKTTHLLQKKR